MTRELIYRSVPAPSEAETVEQEYSPFPDVIAEWPPPVLVTGSVSQKPGSFTAHSNLSGVDYPHAAHTTTIFASGGFGDEYVVPVKSPWEENNLPIESHHEVPLHAALVMIGNENLASEAAMIDSRRDKHTHPVMPHAGSTASARNKNVFRHHQVGTEPEPPYPQRRRPTQEQSIGTDGVEF